MQDGSNHSKRVGAVMDFETVIPIESKPKVYSKFSDKEQLLRTLQDEGKLEIIEVGFEEEKDG